VKPSAKALKLGAEDYLDKPIQQSTLLASIQRTMSSPYPPPICGKQPATSETFGKPKPN
jgi:DNA-binding response OmpR family regulator